MAKIIILSGGERAGKSRAAAEDLLPYTILTPQLFGRWESFLHYGLVGQEFDDTREEFGYLHDGLSTLGMLRPNSVKQPEEGRWRLVTKTGTLVDTWSAKDPQRIRRVFFHGAIVCEPGRVSYDAFTRVLGRVSQTGGWVTAAGTFEGSVGWYPEYWLLGQTENTRGVLSFNMPSWCNNYVYPGGENDPEILLLKQHYGQDTFLERVGAIPAPPKGIVFRLFKNQTHVRTDAEYIPGQEVWIGVDPGRTHAYAVEAVQFTADDHVRVFDEPVYHSGLTNEQAINLVRAKPWYKDLAVIVMDIAGRQRTVNNERSAAEVWAAETGLPVFTNRVGVEDGIERIDFFLLPDPVSGEPRLSVNPRCVGLICEMGAGPVPPTVDQGGAWVYPVDREGHPRSEKPVDRYNDACKALAYLLVHRYGLVRKKRVAAKPRPAYGAWRGRDDGFTYYSYRSS